MTDLSDKTIMITGATSGIGEHTALALARMGAELVLVCRNPDKAEATRETITRQTGNNKAEIVLADLSSLAQVRAAAETFLATGRPLHVLLNNAGLLARKRTVTEDGYEAMFAVNHLAPFVLTNLLLERIKASAPARIVNVASRAHRYARDGIPMDDVNSEQHFSPMRTYGRSKLANILFTRELASRLEGTGVTANSLHPGVVATGLFTAHKAMPGWLGKVASLFFLSPEKGARTSIYLCASAGVEGVTGAYFDKCKPARPSRAAEDDDAARALWQLSQKMTGLSD